MIYLDLFRIVLLVLTLWLWTFAIAYASYVFGRQNAIMFWRRRKDDL